VRAPPPLLSHVALSAFTFVWGANFVLAAVALREVTPIVFSVSRFAFAALLLFPLIFRRTRREGAPRPRPRPAQLARLVAVAVLGAALAPWLGIEGLARSTAGRAALYPAMAPAISALVGRAMGHETLSATNAGGLLLVGLGSVALAADRIGGGGDVTGDLLLGAAVVAAVAELHLIKALATAWGPATATAWRTTLGTALYALVALPFLLATPWGSLSSWTWVAIVLGGTIGVGLGSWVKVAASEILGPTRVIVYGNLVPLTTALLGALALHQYPSAFEGLAGLFVVAGAFLVQRRDRTAAGT
jgi:drug/metabolite transporter (DMT)-like permease